MSAHERELFKQRCGGSWKLVLRFIMAGEACCRREKSQAIAGPGHSIAVTASGAVYTFGSNNSGQLGHGNLEEEWRPRVVRYFQNVQYFIFNLHAHSTKQSAQHLLLLL